MNYLDTDCISQISDNSLNKNEISVQVLSWKQQNDGKYIIDISDGKKSLSAVMSSELASQFKENKLPIKTNTIIKLTRFNLNSTKNEPKCIIHDISVVSHANGIIGKPIDIDTNEPKSNQNPTNDNNSNKRIDNRYQPISTLNPYQSGWRIKVRVTQKGTMRTYSRDGKENVLFSMNLLDSEGTEIQATMFNDACKKFYPKIEEGSIYYVGNGRVTIARRRYTHIQNDYAITLNENSEVTLVPQQDNSLNNNNSDNNNNSNNNNTIMKQVYRFTNISNMINCKQGTFVDVCAIVYEVKDIGKVISKSTGKELKRRNISLCDETCKLIDVTIWGNLAEEYDNNKLINNPIIVMKAARISEYAGGKQLTCNNKLLINPFDTIKESKKLHNWWNNQNGKSQKFEPLAVMSTGTSKTPRYDIFEVKEYKVGFIDEDNNNNMSNMGGGPPLMTPTKATLMSMRTGRTNQGGTNTTTGNQATFFDMIGTITRSFQLNEELISGGSFDQSNVRLPWYKACIDPKMNNAKVTDAGNGKYYCAKNGQTYDNYTPRYVTRFCVNDYSGQIWTNAFNDQARIILGIECKEIENYFNNKNYEKVNNIFRNCHFKKYLFRVKAKSQEYNGEQRIRYDLVNVRLINFKNEIKYLTEKIDLLKVSSNNIKDTADSFTTSTNNDNDNDNSNNNNNDNSNTVSTNGDNDNNQDVDLE